MARLVSGHAGGAAVQCPPAASMHKLASQSSLILFGRAAAFGLAGNRNHFEQNHSSKKAWLIIFISTLSSIMHFRVLKSYLKKEKKSIISSSYSMWLSKMFLIISKDRVKAGAQLKGEEPRTEVEGNCFTF